MGPLASCDTVTRQCCFIEPPSINVKNPNLDPSRTQLSYISGPYWYVFLKIPGVM